MEEVVVAAYPNTSSSAAHACATRRSVSVAGGSPDGTGAGPATSSAASRSVSILPLMVIGSAGMVCIRAGTAAGGSSRAQ
ncbi:hypothetical protein [Micromonospora sp. M42]|uniref:hypothetical protein n=1 Tax=Micromonospora sp. M42 TaxID=457406 RepID=UPI001CB79C7C|nr:hypothetical protein [Micromonospora sp. M42]